MKPVPLSTSLGELMAPQTLVTALLISPDGTIALEPGALHGRSQLEGRLRFVSRREELREPQRHWFIWVAVELDDANQPVRYKGLAASELWVDPGQQAGYKVLAESINRMSEAMRGGVNLKTLGAGEKRLIAQQLAALSAEAWERSAQPLKDELT